MLYAGLALALLATALYVRSGLRQARSRAPTQPKAQPDL